MVATNSEMLELGTQAPEFKLIDTVSGEIVSDADLKDKPLAVLFISAHCPFVVHIQDRLGKISQEFSETVNMIAICSNDIEGYPDDAPDKLAEQAKEFGFAMPYLYDETQEVARAYRAACTPDIFVFNSDHKLVYRGQFDSTRPGGEAANGEDLVAALSAVANAQPVSADQKPSLGCNIKWKPGNEPDYFG